MTAAKYAVCATCGHRIVGAAHTLERCVKELQHQVELLKGRIRVLKADKKGREDSVEQVRTALTRIQNTTLCIPGSKKRKKQIQHDLRTAGWAVAALLPRSE